ncbi:HAD family phosphatase [Labrenzia sp. VG12]|uniref:HAD family hydrolase n=1 Tax=Labrenzia sp. VG12 TaxID=2021862 RepID=UPI000B8BDA46|nr:HAD family phosphatase [Labrenzia sp. VG12]ASP34146.1 phosphatase [Labrenzia sp. VG12]
MHDLDTRVGAARALIFDCDGTLLRTPELYAAGWQMAFRTVGQEMDPDWYHHRAGMSERVLLDEFEAEFNVKLDRAGVVRAMRQAVLAQIEEVQEIVEVAAVARAHAGQKPMAVASGGPKAIVVPSLEAAGLLPLFDCVVTIEDVAHAKPAPDLFLEAADRLKTPAGSCLVFEDSRQGLEAAGRAGMDVIDVNALIAPRLIS